MAKRGKRGEGGIRRWEEQISLGYGIGGGYSVEVGIGKEEKIRVGYGIGNE